MADAHPLDFERADLRALPGIDFVNVDRLRIDWMLAQPAFHNAERQASAVNRDFGELGQKIRHRADVVFVAVRQRESGDALAVFAQVGEVGDDQVNAR